MGGLNKACCRAVARSLVGGQEQFAITHGSDENPTGDAQRQAVDRSLTAFDQGIDRRACGPGMLQGLKGLLGRCSGIEFGQLSQPCLFGGDGGLPYLSAAVAPPLLPTDQTCDQQDSHPSDPYTFARR